MKSLKTLLAGALLMFSASVSAQATYEAADGSVYTFKKHAFIDLQAGLQHTLGEAKFKDLLSPNLQGALGYQFSPVIGARLQANFWQSKGGWNGYGNPPYTKDYAFDYVAPGVDVIFNLSNLIGGYNPTRVVSVAAFLGGGANIAMHNGQVNGIKQELGAKAATDMLLEYVWDGTKVRPFGRGGLQLNFRLGDMVDLFLEGNANILSDKYNSKKAGNPDWYFNGLVGLRVNLGKTYTKQEPVVTPPPTQPTTIPTVPVTQPTKPEPVTPPVVTVEPLRRDIFFVINKYEIRESERSKVAEIAAYLNKYPNAKVALCGYADAGTGNDQINDRLGRQRVNVVKDMLVKEFYIPESRITTDSKGAREQPFAINEQNRVTIAIAE
jgi:outer membrane protein OmpA-like peptidoglycan-associated protein